MIKSRLIRVYLIAMGILVLAAAAHLGLSTWIAARSIELAREDIAVPEVLNDIAQTSSSASAIGGAIATITTALIARYGAREATRNIGGRRNVGEGTTTSSG